MQTLGERLQEARQRLGVTLREAAEFTKIRTDYLQAMEANQFESIPLAEVYKRGFVKVYARYLRLDDENRAAFEEALSSPLLSYEKKGVPIDLSFCRAPERLFDDPDELVEWARVALAAARRVAAKRKRTTPKAATRRNVIMQEDEASE